MKGTYTVRIRNNTVAFTLRIERNITIIRGDSATGKTTFIDMLVSHERFGPQSGVRVQSEKDCHVLTDFDWSDRLPAIRNSIIFVDEGNRFVSTREFAQAIQGTDNYYVLVTRKSLYQLPYSVNAVLRLKTTTSKFDITYVKSYPMYTHLDEPDDLLQRTDSILTEDSNSGYEMFAEMARCYGIQCDSAEGKSDILRRLRQAEGTRMLVVADGAAFGAEMDKVYAFCQLHPGKVWLYLPESFEWLILKSGVLGERRTPRDILADPASFIDSREFLSWEQFFTRLLMELTDETYMQYNKHHLNPFYLQPGNVYRILETMAEP